MEVRLIAEKEYMKLMRAKKELQKIKVEHKMMEMISKMKGRCNDDQ